MRSLSSFGERRQFGGEMDGMSCFSPLFEKGVCLGGERGFLSFGIPCDRHFLFSVPFHLTQVLSLSLGEEEGVK